jgi:non-heme Fe2+,alpha-ketoglutarate-dependent halogenase
MNKSFDVTNFNENGVAGPYSLKNQYPDRQLENEYFDFKKKAEQVFGKTISLKPHLLSPFFDKLAKDESIIEKVKQIIGEDIYIWSSAFFPKAPGDGKIVSYHQDNPYWQLTTTKVITAWIALTQSNQLSGALELVPGSHKLGLIKKLDVENPRASYLKGDKTTPKNDVLSYNQNLKEYIAQNKPMCFNLKPGEFSLHHVNTVHGSGVNESDHYRIGFAIRYVSSETQHLMEKSDLALHISGKKNSYYEDEVSPKENFNLDAINQYKKSNMSTGVFGNKKY